MLYLIAFQPGAGQLILFNGERMLKGDSLSPKPLHFFLLRVPVSSNMD